MKILLIGEYSGVHNNLKRGLTALGHNVKLAADGDGFKKFGYDFRLAPYNGFFVGKIKNVVYVLRNIRMFMGYDVIQFINPFSIPYYYSFFFVTFIFFKFNKRSVYYVCGTDPAFLAAKDKFKYFPFDDPRHEDYPKYNLFALLYYHLFIRQVDIFVPAMYTYAVGYWNKSKLSKPIPFPGSYLNIKEVMPVGNKVRILFGISRKGFKGVDYILSALKLVETYYSDRCEILIVEKLPFSQYVNLLSESDILIDQCKTYDYGMNALFALEFGCIVLSGSEVESQEYLKMESCPVFNIRPDVQEIFSCLQDLIEKRNDEIFLLKKKSQEFAQKWHDLETISKNFIQVYTNEANIVQQT